MKGLFQCPPRASPWVITDANLSPCKGKSFKIPSNIQSFCPYRAPCYLPLYPGQCPGLGASALSGRAASRNFWLSGCKVITLFVNRRKNLFIISVFYEIFRKSLPCSSLCSLFLLFAGQSEWYETPSYCSISPYYQSIYDEIQKNMRKLFG